MQRRLMQVMTNSFHCGVHLYRMGLRRSNECTLCQRVWRQREVDEHEGCGRSDPETLGHMIDQEYDVWTTRSNRMVFSWMDGQKSTRTSTWNQGVKNGVRLGAGRYRFETRLQQGVHNWLQGWGKLPNGVDRVISRAEILRTGR